MSANFARTCSVKTTGPPSETISPVALSRTSSRSGRLGFSFRLFVTSPNLPRPDRAVRGSLNGGNCLRNPQGRLILKRRCADGSSQLPVERRAPDSTPHDGLIAVAILAGALLLLIIVSAAVRTLGVALAALSTRILVFVCVAVVAVAVEWFWRTKDVPRAIRYLRGKLPPRPPAGPELPQDYLLPLPSCPPAPELTGGAHVYGESGAWKDFRAQWRLGWLDRPEQLEPYAALLRRRLAEMPGLVSRHLEELQSGVLKAAEWTVCEERRLDDLLAEGERVFTAEVAKLQEHRSVFVRWRLRLAMRKIRAVHTRWRDGIAAFRRDVLAKRSWLDTLTTTAALEELNRTQITPRLEQADSALHSKEYFGALGECQVIGLLRRLGPDYHLFNDIRLVAQRAYHFEEQWLQSAQIDHLVVGPNGVFVLETKSWGRKSVADESFFDPRMQVKRAGYLAYKELGCSVASIVVAVREMPRQSRVQKVWVLRAAELPGFIRRWKGSVDVARIVNHLRGFETDQDVPF